MLSAMTYAHWVAGQVLDLARENRLWMTWNLILAALPAVIAVPLFRHVGRRGVGWWTAFVAFVLLLPNAPYVVTDLIHLPEDAQALPSRGAIVVGLLPMYAVFVFLGLACYVVALNQVDAYLDRIERPKWKQPAEICSHVVCSLGVVLGRVARLNSWDTITSPDRTVRSVTDTLSWSGTPERYLVVLATTWLGFLVVRAILRWGHQAGQRVLLALR
jgi:uncharacterized membrane protein